MPTDNRFKLLYVDDEADNLTVFSSRFKRVFKIYTATSASEGLELIARHSIQVVISDQRMPEMTGVEFLKNVRDKFPDAVRIILTAYTDAEDIIEAINKGGVYSFVRKPWDGDDLKGLIDKAISFYNLRLQNRDLIQRLYTSINELEMFHYRISHELRGPIASQFGVLSLAKSDEDPDNSVHYLRMLEDAVRKLDATIRRIESTHLPTNKGQLEEVDFQAIIDRVLIRLKDEIDGRGVKFEIDIETDIGYRSYQNLVNAFMENLLENGIYFSDPAKSARVVKVAIRQDEGEVVILVEDNGLGIDESQLSSVFNAFYRGNAISKGNGLGLYIVKKSVDHLSGKIAISSEEEKGTQILIHLPLQVPEEIVIQAN